MNTDLLLSAFEPPLLPDAPLRLEVNLHMPGAQEEATLYVALRVGMERLYVVRSLPAFLRAMAAGEAQRFGKGFVLDPASVRFDKADEMILALLSELAAHGDAAHGKFMPLHGGAAARLLRILRARPFRVSFGREMLSMGPIERRPLPIECGLEEQGAGLLLTIRCDGELRPVLPSHEFVRFRGEWLQLPREQRGLARVLSGVLADGRAALSFPAQERGRVVAELLPQLERAADVRLSGTLAARVRREELHARAYIDREGERIVVRVQFQYGDRAIDPFAAVSEDSDTLLVRDARAEHAVLETLSQFGFRVGGGQIYLAGAGPVLRFIQEGAAALQKVAEVFASDAFTRMRPRRPKLSGSLRMVGGALRLTLMDDDTPIDEIAGLMQALRERKRYFRLRDGAYLALSGLTDWEELSDMVGDADDTDEPVHAPVDGFSMRSYRAAYLVSMLGERRLPVAIDDEVRQTANLLKAPADAPPEKLRKVLRPYQARGFQWIAALHRLRMGGILADDMGLGKTLQVIAAVLWAKEREGNCPSLVVAPTSLVYNWQQEVQRFAPGLSATVIEGTRERRAELWDALKADWDTDIIITSYPLLRRDSAAIGDAAFRFVVLDEAQHIKNPQSLAALAAGRLSGRTRLALTGTPMENSPGELWSIFHFALPGYLAPLPLFMRRHGDGGGADLLRQRIRPFLLRRLKADVLPELPDKIESRVLADMPVTQRNVYLASAMQLKERVERVLMDKGMGRGRMEVLSAITQLRQICCHPSLVLSDYEGSSGKLDALMEILSSALSTGHRVLLFSQFTSMLDILRRRLHAEDIKTLHLDGKTPTVERLSLVSRFNGGEGQVFLISLKAGGAGLNLTGADMVIHYDPWWNPAAEDQATDRAHRIGQRSVVQVIRLITRGTIEEQVARLAGRKRKLFDAVVTAGEMMPQDLSEEEIMGLFG